MISAITSISAAAAVSNKTFAKYQQPQKQQTFKGQSVRERAALFSQALRLATGGNPTGKA